MAQRAVPPTTLASSPPSELSFALCVPRLAEIWTELRRMVLEVPAVPPILEKKASCHTHILTCSSYTEACDSDPPLNNRGRRTIRGRGSRPSGFHDCSEVTSEVLPQLHPESWLWGGPISKYLASLLVSPCFIHTSSSVPFSERPSVIPQLLRGFSQSTIALHRQGPAGPSLSEEVPFECLSFDSQPLTLS